MDGASCLSGRNVVDPVSDAAWMALKVRDGLCALQDADADCTGYPRFKRRDDTCALWGIFTADE